MSILPFPSQTYFVSGIRNKFNRGKQTTHFYGRINKEIRKGKNYPPFLVEFHNTLKQAKEIAKERDAVQYVYVDINCRQKVKFVDGRVLFFLMNSISLKAF